MKRVTFVLSLVMAMGLMAIATGFAQDAKVKKNAAKDAKDIVDTAVDAGAFKTLAAALKAADLIETLKGKGPFTVFAPTDEAFAKLPKGTVEDLLKPENKKKLVSILTYHVVAGKVMAADVVKLKEAKTVEGSKIKIEVKDGKVKVAGARPTSTITLACKAGTTPSTCCARVLLRTMNTSGHYDSGDFLAAYIAFMTTPDSHDDT